MNEYYLMSKMKSSGIAYYAGFSWEFIMPT